MDNLITSDQYRPSSRAQSSPRLQRKTPMRMPKAQALVLAQKFKRGLVIASILCFGTVGGLVMSHTTGSTAQQTTSSTPSTTPSSSQSSSSQSSSQQQGGGYGFGTTSSTQQSVSKSSVS
jgi:hypothetical protein